MTDREKVINGLECCNVQNDDFPPLCEECPYRDDKIGSCEYYHDILSDALTLLKAQSEIVHCKDCEEFATDLNGNTFCLRYDSYFGLQDPNDFCSHGKRKQEAEHDSDNADP